MQKALILAALAAVSATPALAGPREDMLAGISRCAALPDDRTFLDCVYGAAQPMRARLGLPPAPAAQQRLVPPATPVTSAPPVAPRAAAAQPKSGGVLSNMLGNDRSAAWIEIYSFDGKGLFTVTFANGQVWKQDPSDTARAHWNGRGSDYSIIVATDPAGRTGQLTVRGDGTYLIRRLR